MTNVLTSIDELVTALGGTAEVAEWAGVNQTAVCNWISRGFVPAGWHLRLLVLTRKKGIRVSHTVFGLTEEEFALLPEKGPPSPSPKKRGDRRVEVIA